MAETAPACVTFTLTEPAETPWLGASFGDVALVLFVLGTLAFSLAGEPWRGPAPAATLVWGCAILTFLSGVRRGVSFRAPGCTTAAQVVAMLWLFCLGFAAMVLTATALPAPAAGLLILGCLSLEILDPIVARRLEAPLYVARLRPAEMTVPVVCLALAVVLLLVR